jgi:NADPH-dependent 2,4-dienoyl-CoA reductase/sulfur reductase-like enzyme
VTLYEKTGQLGGQLFHGDYFPFKWPIRNFKNWLIYELGQSGVKVQLNTEPTPQMIVAGGYDAVLAATGAQVNIPDIPGLKDQNGDLKPEYKTWAQATVAPEQLGKQVVIVGGSEVGVETAMYLCGLGHDVTVLTRQKKLAHNASGLHYITMAFVKAGPNGEAREAPAWEMYDNLTGITGAQTLKVEGNTVTYQTQDGVQTITGDSIVVCGGMTPQTAAAFSYAGLTDQFYAIGDCNGAGNLEVCNREAYSRAMIL